MSPGRRGVLLVGIALLLGGLAASDVARREAALQRREGPVVDLVVARGDLAAGRRIAERDLRLRRVPLRFAPAGAALTRTEVAGGRLAVAVPKGAPVGVHMLVPDGAAAGVPVRRGERAVEVVASGSPELVTPGARVDVLVTRERSGTELALEDVEVLAAGPALDAPQTGGGPRVAATLRVTVRQAVFLIAAQSFAREVRLLPRAAGDRGRSGGVAVGEGL